MIRAKQQKKRVDVLFICPLVDSGTIPLGILSLASFVKQHGFTAAILCDAESELEYEISQSEEIWILELNYNHSIHFIEVKFDQNSPLIIPTEPTSSPEYPKTKLPSTVEIALIVILVVVALGLTVNIIKKRRS